MRSPWPFALALLALSLAGCLTPDRPLLVQGIVGGIGFQDLDLEDGDLGEPGEADPDLLPVLGFSVTKPLTPPAPIDLGLEAGAFGGWNTERFAFVAGGGGAAIAIDADVVFVSLFGGGALNVHLGRAARLYAGGGPLLLIAWADSDDDDLDDDFSESSSRGGVYARTGIEFDVGPLGTLGVMALWLDSSVGFDSLGEADAEGIVGAITLTRAY
jgi:hypothetical protein